MIKGYFLGEGRSGKGSLKRRQFSEKLVKRIQTWIYLGKEHPGRGTTIVKVLRWKQT